LFCSILTLTSYITFTANIVILVKINRVISPLITILVMLALLALFIYRQYRFIRYQPELSDLRISKDIYT
jgi:uncharacterized membrane protein YjgN (DUF898 family)